MEKINLIDKIVDQKEFDLWQRQQSKEITEKYSWGLNVFQTAPYQSDFEVLIPVIPSHLPRIKEILSKYKDPIEHFFQIKNDHFVQLYTDLEYNSYLLYYDCLLKLIPFFENCIFYIQHDQEGGDGRHRFIVDRYQTEGGKLSFQRVISKYGMGEEDPGADSQAFRKEVINYFKDNS